MTTYRDYDNAPSQVVETYRLNHINQTVDYVRTMIDTHCTRFNKCKMHISKVIELQDTIIDESDPDTLNAQILHAYQTAEYVRKIYPDLDYLHLVGLLHDCGKVLLLDKFGGLPQWSVVGDIFPVGCQYSNKIVYHDFFPEDQSLYGIYQPNCGIDNLLMSFSHDNYLYSVLKHNKCQIPEDGLKIIRYHSWYSWHTGNDYEYFMTEDDYRIRELCHNFSKCDLYSKTDSPIDIDRLKPYYDELINKYFPDPVLEW